MRVKARLGRKHNTHLSQFVTVLFLAFALLTVSGATLTSTRGEGNVRPDVLQAYTGLADVYQIGGTAPDLVARLNAAINLTEQARIKNENGDVAGAASLNNQAEADITSVLNAIPAAQRNAAQISEARIITTAALVPVSVAASTLLLYLLLRVRRHYERHKLYEMFVIEKTKD